MTRVLVVDQEPPDERRDGGSARMVAILRLLREDGHHVTLATIGRQHATPDGAHRLRELGIESATRGAEDWMRDEGDTVDIVIASRLPVAEAMLSATRRHCRSARFVYDATHVEHLAKFRLAKLTGNQPLLAAALRDRSAERDVVTAADAVLATSAEDAAELRALDDDADVHVVTAAHSSCDADDLAAGPRAGVLFLGFLGMPENVFAARRLIDRVWPLIENHRGPTPLTVIGDRPPGWLTAAAAHRPGLTVAGRIDDIDPVLRSAAVLLNPLSGGSGIKTKVLHAFSRHLPVVATNDGVRGIAAVDGVHFLSGETDHELAAATTTILRNPTVGRALAERAATLLRERFNDDLSRAGLRAALARHRVHV